MDVTRLLPMPEFEVLNVPLTFHTVVEPIRVVRPPPHVPTHRRLLI